MLRKKIRLIKGDFWELNVFRYLPHPINNAASLTHTYRSLLSLTNNGISYFTRCVTAITNSNGR